MKIAGSNDWLQEQVLNLASARPEIYEAAFSRLEANGPAASAFLVEALKDEGLGSVGRWRILRLLRRWDRQEAVPDIIRTLRQACQARDSVLLYGAMEALAGFHHPDVTQTLIVLLQVSDPDIVKFAAVLAGQNGDFNLITPLSKLLQQPSASIRYSGVKGLMQMDHARARDELRRHFGVETDGEIRELIASANLREET